MPVNVAAQMEFDFEATQKALKDKHQLGNILLERWYKHLDGGRKKRVIWDLSLIQAIIHPEWAETMTITTSKDNGAKELTFYKTINQQAMKAEFFQKLNAYFEK